MPAWTLRLVACASVLALIGRLPASLTDAFWLALGLSLAAGIALAAAEAPRLRRTAPSHA